MSPASRTQPRTAAPRTRTSRARKASGPVRLALDEELTVQVAEHTKGVLLTALAGGDRLVLDLTAVAEIDTAGLQVLLLLAREARAAGKTVEVDGISGAVAEVLALARIGTTLGASGQEETS